MNRFEKELKVEGTRRSLLARALRLTPEVEPEIFALLDACRERLEVEESVELYVFASPNFNAALARPEGGHIFVLLSSSLMESFSPEELRFVVGHELGHYVYDHHAIPLPLLFDPRSKLPADLYLKLHTWQRYAEISADRAGLFCTAGMKGVARALFKLSSGLHDAPDDVRIAAFMEQADELFREAERASSQKDVGSTDWMSTHPFTPFGSKRPKYSPTRRFSARVC